MTFTAAEIAESEALQPKQTQAANMPSVPQTPLPQPAEQKANIFIAGPSGSGKSTSLRNLDPERTIILSTEMKALPFRGAKRFKMNTPVSSFAMFQQAFNKALHSDKADVIVLDSFTSLAEFAYTEIHKAAGDSFAGWAAYKDALHNVLIKSKQSNKYVVFIGIDTIIQDDQQRITRTIDVQGSLKGKVEKEFVCVFWSKVLEPDLASNTGPRHVLATNSDGTNTAKSPMGMFDELYIDNDLAAVIKQVAAYYGDE